MPRINKTSDLAGRLKKFWDYAPSKNLIYLISQPADIFYLLGQEFAPDVFLTIGPKKSELNLFCPTLLADDFIKKIPAAVKINNSRLNEEYLLKKNLPVAINPRNLNGEFLLRLKKSLGRRLHFYNFTDNWRMIKDDGEIAIMRRAAKIIARIVRQAWSLLRRGIKEKELARWIVTEIEKAGGEPAFYPIVAFGKNTAWPHHRSGETIFTGKGPVLIDAGCRLNGYCSDITRAGYFAYGLVPDKLYLKVYETVKEAKNAAEKFLKAGRTFAEVDNLARKIISAAGFGDNFVHGLGHGIGIEVHEPPQPRKDVVLETNMVFTVEPGIYLADKFGVRLEDTILLTRKGPEILTFK